MELAQTSRGAQKLLYGGYGYILDKNAYDRKFWRCEERRQCKGRITTNIGCTDIKKPPSAHNHPPDAARVIAIKAVTAIKQRATTSEEATSSVINTCTQDVPLSAAVAMPRNDNLARMVRRKRQAPDGEDIQIMHTTRGQEFVSLHDDGVVIFTTMDNLNFLRANRNWFCDGTFDSAPEQHQLFTIHALLHDTHTLPLVYCVANRKNEPTYNRILDHLKEQRPDLDPLSITVDFEMASINAMVRAFPDIEIYGCYFHFCQATYRHIQGLGLQNWYRDSPDNSLIIKSFQVTFHYHYYYTAGQQT